MQVTYDVDSLDGEILVPIQILDCLIVLSARHCPSKNYL